MSIENPILLEMPMPIITPRLKIVPAHPQYAEAFQDAKVESVDFVLPWMVWAKHGAGTLDDSKELLARKYAEFVLREEFMLLAFTHDGELVVATGIQNIGWYVPMAEIGYWVKKSAAGQGYVTEAANALIRYGFQEMGMRKMSICMDSENTASEAVPLRLNMTLETETTGGMPTLHPPTDALRVRKRYVAFDTQQLPALDVSW